jgi:hypothetical protein
MKVKIGFDKQFYEQVLKFVQKNLYFFQDFAKFSSKYQKGNQKKNFHSISIFAFDLLFKYKYFCYTIPYFKLKFNLALLKKIHQIFAKKWSGLQFDDLQGVYTPFGYPLFIIKFQTLIKAKSYFLLIIKIHLM